MDFLGIRYPFTSSDSEKFYFDLNSLDTTEIKTLILHIMLTPRKQRYRMPDFGSDLLKFIFEPNDSTSIDDIKKALEITIGTYIPGITVDDLTVDETSRSPYSVYLRLDYTIQEGVFTSSDFVEISL